MSDAAIADRRSWCHRAPEVLERDVGDEVVLTVPGSTDVAVLSPSAGMVWRSLETPRTFVDLVKSLARRYERPVESPAVDLEGVLLAVVSPGLVANVADGDD